MLIEFKNVVKTYSRLEVLNIPSLVIDNGECVGIVGNNGAGKTTLISLLLDLIALTSGEIRSKGVNVNNVESWKRYTAAFLDESFLISFLTPDEYFDFLTKTTGWTIAQKKELLGSMLSFFNGEILDRKKYIRDLSKGNQKKVGIAGALIGDPEIIILDEPFSNLDPSSQNRLKKIILGRTERQTFLISSHDLNHISEICNRIILLEKGKVILDAPTTADSIAQMNEYFK